MYAILRHLPYLQYTCIQRSKKKCIICSYVDIWIPSVLTLKFFACWVILHAFLSSVKFLVKITFFKKVLIWAKLLAKVNSRRQKLPLVGKELNLNRQI